MPSNQMPRHVAIIMDGNGRWARKHAVDIALGHQRGVEALRGIIRYSSDSGIKHLSLYAFSTENWSRPAAEVNTLMRLIEQFFKSEIDELDAKNVRIRILGDKQALVKGAYEAVRQAEERTRDNAGLNLNIGLNYGARDEILRAVRLLAEDVQKGILMPEDIDHSAFEDRLYTREQPDVDLLIRTSGEQRLSNFLLYQCAYAEMVFPEVLWPDFSLDDYKASLQAYMGRDRRFGGR